jgi:hypothetical protein
MLNSKEILTIIGLTILITILVSPINSVNAFLIGLVSVVLVLLINIFAKKIMGFFLEAEVEIKLWKIERYGLKPSRRFKWPIPAGIIFPILIGIVTLGRVAWLATFVFDVKPRVYRAAKRHGLYSFSEMTEYHMGLIAASGVIANLIAAFIGYLLNFPIFSMINVYMAFYNMIPFSDLDGNKLFFGSFIMWTFLAIVSLIAMGYVLLMV